jgi:two-component system CheB/CheR fusion protein
MRAIGVVLSGTGSDGTLGLAEIKAVGGITFAQDERSAQHPGMPHSAIQAGCVDFALPPLPIAQRIAEIGAHPYLHAPDDEEQGQALADGYQSVLSALLEGTGVNFAQHKDGTIRRRIARRMAVAGLDSVDAYAAKLTSEPAELNMLYRDLLINVTSFFRDPRHVRGAQNNGFAADHETAAAQCATAHLGSGLRQWSGGLFDRHDGVGILRRPTYAPAAANLCHRLERDPSTRARSQRPLPETIEAEVPAERLRRFFKRDDHHYRIDKQIRDACIFARQNLAADPPFSHVDVISCRNVLIYMASPLQKRVLPMFHWPA